MFLIFPMRLKSVKRARFGTSKNATIHTMTTTTGLLILALLGLFYLLGKSADVVITHIRLVAEKLGVSLFFLGILLGMLTSIPELAIGVNAITQNIGQVALGNLTGGIVVLYCLILGTSAILNRKVDTNGKIGNILPIFFYLLLPIGLGLDGKIGIVDGILLIVLYIWILYMFYVQRRPHERVKSTKIKQTAILKEGFYIVTALIVVVASSAGIVRITQHLLGIFPISPFVVGLILFSIGTNLPELIVTVRSWQKNIRDLSLSNLIGSSISNILLIGIFATMRQFSVPGDVTHYAFGAFMILMLAVVFVFYRTGDKITRTEGLALISLYIVFLISQALAATP